MPQVVACVSLGPRPFDSSGQPVDEQRRGELPLSLSPRTEAALVIGLASEIAAQVAGAGFDDLDAPIRRLHGAFAPTPYSPALEAAMIPSAATIAAAIRELVNE